MQLRHLTSRPRPGARRHGLARHRPTDARPGCGRFRRSRLAAGSRGRHGHRIFRGSDHPASAVASARIQATPGAWSRHLFPRWRHTLALHIAPGMFRNTGPGEVTSRSDDRTKYMRRLGQRLPLAQASVNPVIRRCPSESDLRRRNARVPYRCLSLATAGSAAA